VRPLLNARAVLALAAAGASFITGIVTTRAAASASAPAATPALAIAVKDSTLRYGDPLVVEGRTDGPNRRLALEFRSPGEDWRAVATGVSRVDGTFGFSVRAARSGEVRVTTAPEAAAAPRSSDAAPPPAPATSPQQRVAVAAGLTARTRTLDVAVGRPVTVTGTLRPGVAGRKVVVRVGRNGPVLARARTDERGRFQLVYRPRAAGSQRVRVVFAGDRANGGVLQVLGTLTAYRRGLASWYGGGGGGACGIHARYGVAHKTLPCGTKVAVRYRGRSVVATVTDRGPFVGGREWDLNGAVASKLGFDGVDYVWTSR
jgi:peptidoglycan lytic transglycosylase